MDTNGFDTHFELPISDARNEYRQTEMKSGDKKPLWTCPECGVRLVTRNMWHSCGIYTLDALFAKSESNVRRTFDKLAQTVKAADGDVTIIPQKTRAVFQLRTRFISVYPRKAFLSVGFVFISKVPNDRFVKIEGPITGAYVHYANLSDPKDVDATIKTWIDAALPYGRQDRALGGRRS